MRATVGLAGLGVAGSIAGCSTSSGAVPPIALPGGANFPVAIFTQPPLLQSANGVLNAPLTVLNATNQVGTPNGLRNFLSRTYNGLLNGPTMKVRPGDQLAVPITNQLPPNPDADPPDVNTPHHFNSTNLHSHGLHVSPGQDNVFIEITPGESFTYAYDVPADHPPGTFWYHPHKHGSTAMQLMSGLAGALIVAGGLDDVPEIAVASDLVFLINELNLNLFRNEPNTIQDPYQVVEYTTPGPFQRGDSIFVVNGEFQPRLQVRPGQVVRLRLINASARNTAPLTVQGNQFHLLAIDGITIPAMRTLNGVTLAPGNRADVLLKIDLPGTYEIRKEEFMTGMGPPQAAQVLAFVDVVGDPFDMPLPAGPLPVPATLPDITNAEVNDFRTLTYNINDPMANPPVGPQIPTGGGNAPNFTINGVRFDPSVINQAIPLGSVIEWTLANPSTAFHPHHIHIQPFQVVATVDPVNGNNTFLGQPLTGPTWADTVDLPPGGSVTARQRFANFPGFFVFHCHVLVHEDIGMMGSVNVF
ncbi:MAG: multicopper oxidase domain-containing protein [Armatimonadetes bacterium]|nr:multicopper oxidase domain-containing protein [Armatimonadota bacterium]